MKVRKLSYFVSETPIEGSTERVKQTFLLDSKAKLSISAFISYVLPYLSARIRHSLDDNYSITSTKLLKSRQITIKIYY